MNPLLPYSSLKRSTKPIRKRRKVKEWLKGVAVRIYPSGREVCQENASGKAEYTRRTEAMWSRQKRLCAICGELMYAPTFDHQDGRGFNGSKRDDRIEINGMRYNAAVHGFCNTEKGSKKVPYQFQ